MTPDEGALPDMSADTALFGLLIGFADGADGQAELSCQFKVRRKAVAIGQPTVSDVPLQSTDQAELARPLGREFPRPARICRKPGAANGQYVITPEMRPGFVEALPVSKSHGIGPATCAKMNAIGRYTASTSAISRSTLQANFGKAGA